ncbi:MAG: helix-hairpin-helix domain-containing protein [Paludibacteraceae bacterium]|nr:helix-hairpin-helix domain-containing protein [Paludibacteraceae bacterium]
MLTRRQWIGLIVVVALVATVVTFVHLVPQRPLPALAQTDTLAAAPKHRWSGADSTKFSKYTKFTKHKPVPIRRRRFNPNRADSIVLLEQGLKPWQVSNLLKYRRAGGTFRRKSDVRRLYGLDESQYQAMASYIDLPDSLPTRRDTVSRDTFPRYVSIKRDTILELNTADTAELQLLRGIGRWTAVQIVRYREQLGGYYTVDQLYEIPHIDTRMLDTVVHRFMVDTALIHPIPVNKCAVTTLSHHPYLRFEQAKSIYEFRRRKVRLRGIDDLQAVPDLQSVDFSRLRPYLSFE